MSAAVYRAVDLAAIVARAEHADTSTWRNMLLAFEVCPRTAPRLPVRRCLDLLLALHATDRVADAAELAAAFERWLGEDDELELGPDEQPLWSGTRELARVAEVVPIEVRAAAAEGLRHGKLAEASRAVARACARMPPTEARGIAAVLREFAPMLAETFAAAIEPHAQGAVEARAVVLTPPPDAPAQPTLPRAVRTVAYLVSLYCASPREDRIANPPKRRAG